MLRRCRSFLLNYAKQSQFLTGEYRIQNTEDRTQSDNICKNKANLIRAKMNASSTMAKDYKNKCPCRPQGKQSQTKPIKAKVNVKMSKSYFSQRRPRRSQLPRKAGLSYTSSQSRSQVYSSGRAAKRWSVVRVSHAWSAGIIASDRVYEALAAFSTS